jgi:hypothetical protein
MPPLYYNVRSRTRVVLIVTALVAVAVIVCSCSGLLLKFNDFGVEYEGVKLSTDVEITYTNAP